MLSDDPDDPPSQDPASVRRPPSAVPLSGTGSERSPPAQGVPGQDAHHTAGVTDVSTTKAVGRIPFPQVRGH